MDVAIEHDLTVFNTSSKSPDKFCKGVVVFEVLASPNPPTDSPATSPPAPACIELGELYVVESELPRCHACNEAGHLKADCPNKDKNVVCRKCSGVGHKSIDCVREDVCRICKEEGHTKENCPKVVCTYCSKSGHVYRHCEEREADKMKCRNCGKPGHRYEDCTEEECGNCGSRSHKVVDCMAGLDRITAGTRSTPADDSTHGQAAEDPAAPRNEGTALDAGSEAADTSDAATLPPAAEVDPELLSDNPPVPANALKLPSSARLDVALHTFLIEEHASAIELDIQSSYEETGFDGRAVLVHKKAVPRFTSENMVGDISVETCDIESTDLLQLLSPTTIDTARRVLEERRGQGCQLQHIRFVAGSGHSGPTIRLGRAFYSNLEFGPATTRIRQARDMLATRERVAVHFFTINNGWFEERVELMNASINTQREKNPLYGWFPQGKPNFQSGQQLEAEFRPKYKLPVRLAFDTDLEWMTMQFYNKVAELEPLKEISEPIATTAQFARLPGGGERVYFATIALTEKLNPRVDASLYIMFDGYDGDPTQAWSAQTVDPVPFGGADDIATFVRRPRRGKGFVDDPDLDGDDLVLDLSPFDTIREAAMALREHTPIRVHVIDRQPRSSVERELNTLRHLSINQACFRRELNIFQSNDFLGAEIVDFFKDHVAKFGENAVATAWAEATATLTEEQSQIGPALKAMIAGVLLVQGPGGTGKSTMIVVLVVFLYKLYGVGARASSPVWIVSPINRQIDDLAQAVHDGLYAEYEKDPNKTKFPIVLKWYARPIETRVYKKDAESMRKEKLDNPPPDYYCTPDNVLELLAAERILYEAYAQGRETGFDKRLRRPGLSTGIWILRRGGIPDANGQPHPIAAPEKHEDWRDLYGRFCSGAEFTQDDLLAFTLATNAIVADVASIADVHLMTPHVASQPRVHKIAHTSAVIHDEASKTSEMATAHSFVWCKPYDDAGKVMSNDPIPHILFGDVNQPSPTAGRNAEKAFANNVSVSLFSRLLTAGASSIHLWEQHRFDPAIRDLINHVHACGRLRDAPGLQQREGSQEAQDAFETAFHVGKPAVYLAHKGAAVPHPVTKSLSNSENVRLTMASVCTLIHAGLDPSRITIGVPYTKQLKCYKTALAALREHCHSKSAVGRLRHVKDRIHLATVVTLDGIQGAQADVFILDWTITGRMGFVEDAARVLLGLGRAMYGLVLIGFPFGVMNHYLGSMKNVFTQSAFYRTYKWFKDNKLLFDLDQPNAVELRDELLKLPFDPTVVVEEVQAGRARDEGAVSYATDAKPNFTVPQWHAGDEDIGNDNGGDEGGDKAGDEGDDEKGSEGGDKGDDIGNSSGNFPSSDGQSVTTPASDGYTGTWTGATTTDSQGKNGKQSMW